MTRIWQSSFPPEAFGNVIKLIKAAIGNDWEELVHRIPGLK
jgi:hypothetical protein